MFGRIIVLALVSLLVLALVLGGQIRALGGLSGALIDALAPIQELLADTYHDVAGSGRTVATVDQLVIENQRLRNELDRLAREAVRGPELQRENDELRDLLGLKRSTDWQWIEGRVIGFDSTNLVRSITINRGAQDGIVDGMTAMTPRGTVGKVVKVGTRAARILLLTDPSSSANVMVQRSRARGVIYGQRGPAGTSTMVMRYIPQGDDIRAGDRIITSGLGGIFPEGIAVGQVTQVRQRDTDMFQEASVEPLVDFPRLETVYVIINHVPVKLD